MELEPSNPVPVDRLPSELSLEPVCELAELRTSPPCHPTLPDERVVDEVDDSRRIVPVTGWCVWSVLWSVCSSLLNGEWALSECKKVARLSTRLVFEYD